MISGHGVGIIERRGSTGGLNPTDSPTFVGVTLSGLTASRVVVTDASRALASGTNTDTQISGAVTKSHDRQHSITATADHTSTATSGKMLKADTNGLPVDATNTDTVSRRNPSEKIEGTF